MSDLSFRVPGRVSLEGQSEGDACEGMDQVWSGIKSGDRVEEEPMMDRWMETGEEAGQVRQVNGVQVRRLAGGGDEEDC